MSNSGPSDATELVDPRIYYLVPEDQGGRIAMLDLVTELWRSKWIVLGVGLVFALIGVVYSLLATEWYRSETIVVPANGGAGQNLGQQLGGLGGIATLAGLNLGEDSSADALSVLRSRKLAREFIDDNELLTVFLADQWDAEAGTWAVDDPSEAPDIRDAVAAFHESVLDVEENPAEGTITIAAQWTDPETAAAWSNELVARVNRRMRVDAITEAETSIAFLSEQLAETELSAVRAGTARILESEIQKLTLAKGREDYAFKVVDPGVVPRGREWPKRKAIVILAAFFGAVLASFVVIMRVFWRDHR